MNGTLMGANSIGWTMLLIAGGMVIIGAIWFMVGLRKVRSRSMSRNAAWNSLMKEFHQMQVAAKKEAEDTKDPQAAPGEEGNSRPGASTD